MKRKISAVVVSLAMTVSLLTGCGSASTNQTSNNGVDETVVEDTENAVDAEVGDTETSEVEEAVPATVYEAVSAPTSYVSEAQMAMADQWAASDESSIAAVMRKASRGEDITIAVLGGSITQGTISNGSKDSEVEEKKMYAEIFHDWWTTTYPDVNVNFVNAGIGATDSYLGVHRVQKDVLDYNPDMVIIEYSVNDSGDNSCKIAYDNLIRKIALSESSPAILLLFMAQTNGSSAQGTHCLVGFSYQMPMLSYKNVIDDMMETGEYTANELAGDQVHPTALGHRITGEIIWKYLNSIYENQDTYEEPKPFDFPVNTFEKFAGTTAILDSETIEPSDMGTFEKSNVFYQFNNDWSTSTPGGEITFNINCRNLGIMYYCQTNGAGAVYDVIVDGVSVNSLNADFSGGWGNYAATKEVYASDEAAEHVVTLKQKENSAGDEFTILGLLVTE